MAKNIANKNGYWERLESVIRWANMTINYFGRHIGLSRSENLYQIKAGKNGISQNLGRRIVEKFPEISLAWLLTGEGEMLQNNSLSEHIPFYDVDVQGRSITRISDLTPECRMNIPVIDQCDCAMRFYDTAMKGEITPGTIVFLKETGIESIIPGGIYVVASRNYALLRRVRLSADDGGTVLTLEPSDGSADGVRVPAAEVECVYRVVAHLRLC